MRAMSPEVGARRAKLRQRVLTVEDVAHYLRIRTSTVYKLLRDRKLRALKPVGGDWRLRLRDVDSWRLEMQRDWNDVLKGVDWAGPL